MHDACKTGRCPKEDSQVGKLADGERIPTNGPQVGSTEPSRKT